MFRNPNFTVTNTGSELREFRLEVFSKSLGHNSGFLQKIRLEPGEKYRFTIGIEEDSDYWSWVCKVEPLIK